jgi:hypothetical protein
MLDMVHRFIRLNREIAALPFKTAREALGPNRKKAHEALHIAEDISGLPFQMAEQMLNNTFPPEEEQLADKTGTKGPGARNIFVNPEVTVVRDENVAGHNYRRAELKVTGLLCEA